MAKKTLNEATIRRFQKLAMVAPINETYNMRDDQTEGLYEAEEDDMEGGEEMLDAGEPEGEELGDEAPMDDMGAGGMDMELTEEEAQTLIELGKKLESAMGEGEEDMGDMEMEDEEDMGEEDIMEALSGISYKPSQSEVVNEVAKRVARRLKQAKLHEAKLNRALGKRR